MSTTKTTVDCDILIVGAGIAGSALACALRNRGYKIIQVEMSNRPLDTARGDHLQCAVVETLDQWGALPAFWAAGAEKRHAARYVTSDGELILDIDYRKLPVPHPYYMYLHHDLLAETFLNVAAEGMTYTLFKPARARDFDVGPEGIQSLTIKLAEDTPAPAGFKSGQTVVIKPKLVVGADGRSSRVREVLDFSAEQHEYENPIVLHFAPRLSADEDPLNQVTSFFGPKGSISRIPRAFNHWKVGVTIAKSEISFWKNATATERKAAIAGYAPALGELDLSLGGFYPVKLLNTHRWVKGNTVLVGDACHAMHPARGQGMNVSIRCLSKLLPLLPDAKDLGRADLVTRQLETYEQTVKPGIDEFLAANHAVGEDRDTLDPSVAAKTVASLREIQNDPARHQDYCIAAAGYAGPLDQLRMS
ncbi:MAG: FAD-dependent monooxygenase [Rhodospirillaceae bacterium]|nr:FAD-dependent monooxygenase [Rhodospirillaceae bacterium]